MMIKHPSQSNFKNNSREKSKSKPANSKSKVQTHTNKISHLESNNNVTKYKQKQSNDRKKLKIENRRPQTTTVKLKNENKQHSDNYGLNLKADLKHLINKNKAMKPKEVDLVPQLLNNIEKNCKALKNIHHKQTGFDQKRSSEHSSKMQKQKKMSLQYKKSDQRLKLKQSLQKVVIVNEVKPPKISRFSLQIGQGDAQREKIQQKLRENVGRKSVENSKNDKNFVELFQLYKKSFQIEDFKIEKSNRKTNYNTNQSRNSSSHHNSYGHSRAGEYNFRGKSKDEEKLNIEKIETLIKSQQKKVENQNVSNDSLIQAERLQNQTIVIGEQKKPQYATSLREQKLVLNENSIVNTDENIDCQQKQGSKHFYKNQQILKKQRIKDQFEKMQRSSNKEIEHEKENDLQAQQLFQKSKYYVQQIPKLVPRKSDVNQEENLSLLGCEITLIESNIILEDSELASLQL